MVKAVYTDMLADDWDVDVSTLSDVLDVPRSTVYYRPVKAERMCVVDKSLAAKIWDIIERFPMFGIRRVWAWLRYRMGVIVNRKKVARLMRIKGWTLKKRIVGQRPRVQFRTSVTDRPNERWATDISMVFCGERDGWCSFVAVIDCCTREILGWELSHAARAKTAERALESALINRFGWVRGGPKGMMIRSDNGLVFGSKLYRRLIREYGLKQEYITPYTPEENGLVERFMRSFKEECVWLSRFDSIEAAREKISKWIDWYNTERPHQALDYKSPNKKMEEFNLAA